MEDKGAIYREPNPQDGRSVIIKLTQLGMEEGAFARKVVIRFNEVIRENVSAEQLNHLT